MFGSFTAQIRTNIFKQGYWFFFKGGLETFVSSAGQGCCESLTEYVGLPDWPWLRFPPTVNIFKLLSVFESAMFCL